MDDSRFDDITKRLAAPSRRSLLGLAGASALAALLGRSEAEAKKKKCKKPKIKCGKACVNPKTSPNHCGGCGKRCEGDLTCVNGQCACADTTRSKCGTACVDLQTDEQNCGVCGATCGTGQTCANGGCVENACNPACTGGRVCENGTCECPGTLRDCGAAGCKECCPNENFGYCCPPERPTCWDDFGNEQFKRCGEDGVCRCSAAKPEDCSSPDNPLLFPCQQCCSNDTCVAQFEDPERICFFGNCGCSTQKPALCPKRTGSGNYCTNTLSDNDNCDPFQQCPGVRCGAGFSCQNGACVFNG